MKGDFNIEVYSRQQKKLRRVEKMFETMNGDKIGVGYTVDADGEPQIEYGMDPVVAGYLKSLRKIGDSSSAHSSNKFIRRITDFWELFRFFLPGKIRREAFEPAYNDLKLDFLLARKFKSKWASRWITFCFLFQTLYMIVNCFWVAGGAKLVKLSLLLVPEVVRKFFRIF